MNISPTGMMLLSLMNVKFSKGHLATLKHKSKDIEKNMSRMKK